MARRPAVTKTSIRERPQATFQRVHAWARRLEPEWRTTAITFQRKPELVELGGMRWRIQISMSGGLKSRRDRRVRYTMQILMSSYDRADGEETRRRLKAVYSKVARRLAAHGYSTSWCVTFAIFQRASQNYDVLRREVKRLHAAPLSKVLLR
jgi:hypothetical protein